MEKQLFELIQKDDIEEFKKIIENGFNVNKTIKVNSKFELNNDYNVNRYINCKDITIYKMEYTQSVINTKIVFNDMHMSLLHFACGVSIGEKSSNNYWKCKPPIKIIKYLIEKGANVNKLDSNGCSSLHYACLWYFELCNDENKDSIVKLLVENGADVNMRNNSNYTPLLLIARNCQTRYAYSIDSLIEYLIENGAKIKVNKKSDLNILPVLYRNLMDTYEKYVNKYSYDMDIEDEYEELVDEVDNKYEDLPPTPEYVTELIKYLIDNGAKVNSRDEHGKTILHYAVLFGTLEHVELLINSGADFRIKSDEQQNSTPFHSVMFSRRIYLIKYFTQVAVKVNNLTKYDLHVLQSLMSKINDTSIKKKNNLDVKHEIAGILIRKGFNGSKYPEHTIIGKEYKLYQEEIKSTKEIISEVCQKKTIPSEIQNNILPYLVKETIHEVNFLFNKKQNLDSKKNVDIDTKLLIDKLYNPDLLLFHESQRYKQYFRDDNENSNNDGYSHFSSRINAPVFIIDYND